MPQEGDVSHHGGEKQGFSHFRKRREGYFPDLLRHEYFQVRDNRNVGKQTNFSSFSINRKCEISLYCSLRDGSYSMKNIPMSSGPEKALSAHSALPGAAQNMLVSSDEQLDCGGMAEGKVRLAPSQAGWPASLHSMPSEIPSE